MGHPVGNLPGARPSETRKPLRDGSELLIRHVLPADLPVLAEIYTKTYNGKDTGEVWTVPEAERLLNHLDDKNSSISIVGEINGQIVGATFANKKPWERGKVILEVTELFVDEAFQKRGIGSALQAEAIDIAKDWYHVTDIELVTFEGEVHPKNWYEKLGYEKVTDPELMIMSATVDKVRARLR